MATSSIPQYVNPLQDAHETLLPVGRSDTPYRSISVSDIQLGEGDLLATVTVKIGSVVCRKVTLRKGRGTATYINFPSVKDPHGRRVHLVEIVSPALDAAVRDEINKAVSAAVAA